MRKLLIGIFTLCTLVHLMAQQKEKDPESTYPVSKYEPLTLKITDDGSKYVRFILWHQQWVQSNNLAVDNSKFQLNSLVRRSRFLAYAQVSPRFLILTHWGLNNLSTNNLSSLGNNGDGAQLFLHDAWVEFKVTNSEAVYAGGGLHYWKGLTRLSSQSTLNFMTLDNPRPFVHWHSLGITDQFARHLGFYLKGQLGKLDYRFSVNNPLDPANSLGGGIDFGGKSTLQYTGVANTDEEGNPLGNTIAEGYFKYQFWDKESNKLPYHVGTYLGTKKILAAGLGFFTHPDGMYDTASLEHGNVLHVAGDIFLDAPIGKKGNAINAYLSVINFNYGDNYMSRWAGTGTNIYGHCGYYFQSVRLMPYVAYQLGSYEAFDDNLTTLDIGLNYFVLGHNAKLTAEYHSVQNNPFEGGIDANGNPVGLQQLRLQLHIFL